MGGRGVELDSEAISRQQRVLKQMPTAKHNALPRDETAGLSNCQHPPGALPFSCRTLTASYRSSTQPFHQQRGGPLQEHEQARISSSS